jgi:hypothetical protein
MKTLSKQTKQNVFYLTAIACLMLAGSLSAFAIPGVQVARTTGVQTISAICDSGTCPFLEPPVSVVEPANVTAVIVTWSADYNVTGTSVIGLSLNGGPCTAYGPFTLEEPQLVTGSLSNTLPTTHQWVVFPSDGLVEGKNLFLLCGGGYEESQTINIGYSTLTVQTQ